MLSRSEEGLFSHCIMLIFWQAHIDIAAAGQPEGADWDKPQSIVTANTGLKNRVWE